MKLDVYGNAKEHFSAHGEYEPAADPALAYCPFCGGRDLLVQNTHTPSYSVECETCGAEGPQGRPEKYDGRHIKRRRQCEQFHREAFAAAIAAWNAWQSPKRQ